jgi:hypothetical protein
VEAELSLQNILGKYSLSYHSLAINPVPKCIVEIDKCNTGKRPHNFSQVNESFKMTKIIIYLMRQLLPL